ncbi:hypothetical protein Bcop_2058 [Bacteroides coprosuis DSM 18011]|uniref:Uncharacterized protein n=1 Tax=Bacteroides coprosuis DSM 18011 TaxID=679937 RepID=F3ZSZ1_9BACE|nr:hypothetical protein Bcop_2058 [Bacteroides coprosuis DSM 18011]
MKQDFYHTNSFLLVLYIETSHFHDIEIGQRQQSKGG